MKKIIILILGLIILISGCSQVDLGKVNLSGLSNDDIKKISDKIIVCNEPYIRFETGCCLDKNSNKICDNDETNDNIVIDDNNQIDNNELIDDNYNNDGIINNDKEINLKDYGKILNLPAKVRVEFVRYENISEEITDKFAIFEKEITIRDVHIVGIVPGRIELKFPFNENLNMEILESKDKLGRNIKTQIFKNPTNFVLTNDIFTPLLPGVEYKFNIKYKVYYYNESKIFDNKLNDDKAKVTSSSVTGSAITIDRLESVNSGGNATIYLRNRDTTNNIDLISWKVTNSAGATVCRDATPITGGIVKNTVTSLTTVGVGCSPIISVDTSYVVSIVTNQGVFSAKLIAR